jgi:hypothetical protein
VNGAPVKINVVGAAPLRSTLANSVLSGPTFELKFPFLKVSIPSAIVEKYRLYVLVAIVPTPPRNSMLLIEIGPTPAKSLEA